MTPAMRDWLLTRPASVQRLAAEFPPGSRIAMPSTGGVLYVLGYTEEDMLIVTPIDPSKDYSRANVERRHLHAHHVRPLSPPEQPSGIA